MESDGGRERIRSAAEEEEVLKRKNTDCVYFLASPLTCKKGSECDYRHSEGARVNPRDCWYWLNGNCLNPKCSFRHPRLDFMFATPMANSGPAPPPSQTSASALTQAAQAPNNNSKQSVPCYYFQWGQCLKGEKCPFMHEPRHSVNFVSQQAVTKSLMFSAEPRQTNEKKAQDITKQQNVAEISLDNPKVFIDKHVGVSSTTTKFVTKAENALKLELSENKTLQCLSDNDPPALPQNGIVNDSYLQSQTWGQQVQHPDDKTETGKDADEFLLEHSPGFDVLVDDIEDPDYHHREDNFRRVSAHGCQNMEAEDEYEYHQSDYETRAEIETDLCNDIGQYDNYQQPYSRYDWESKTSSRILERSPSLERRVLDRERKPNAMNGSDLRYQLMKRRRINDSRSTSNHGGHTEHYQKDEQYAKERHYGRHARNNTKFPSEKSISSRLQGRIALPVRTTSEQERRRRPQSKVSPVTRINYQPRNPERAKLLPSKEFSKDEKTRKNRLHPRNGTKSLDFASPKSLSEIKGIKLNENIHDLGTISSNLTVNNVKSKKVEGGHESENPPSFEGPLPLSAILKRKRESAYAENKLSMGRHENNQADGGPAINESVPQLEARNGGNFAIGSPEEEGVIPTVDDLTYDVQSPTKADAMETEHGMTLENEEVEELENYDRQNGDFDFESGEYKVDDENTIHLDEADLDDDDDFARKISIMLS